MSQAQSGTQIASVFAIGPTIAAQVLGLPFSQYRCSGSGPVVTAGNLIGTPPAWITADAKLMGATPFVYGKPVGFAAINPAMTMPGDYLVGSITVGGPTETFFISSQDIPAPIQVVRCNSVINIARAADTLVAGSSGVYSGTAVESAAPFMTGWPAAVLQMSSGSKMGGTGMQLPTDGGLPAQTVFLPGTCPEIRFNDIITDQDDVRYAVSNAELTPLGWRLTVMQWPAG